MFDFLYRELLSLGNCIEKTKHKINFIFVKLLVGWSYRGTFSDPHRVLCPCEIKHNPRRPPPPSSRHRVIFLAIKHNLAQGMFCVSMPELPQPRTPTTPQQSSNHPHRPGSHQQSRCLLSSFQKLNFATHICQIFHLKNMRSYPNTQPFTSLV